jgi:hypothetical protein
VRDGGWSRPRRERAWALAFARAEGISVRTIGQQTRLSPDSVLSLTTDIDLPRLEQALGALRSRRWPAPKDPDASDDEELTGRALVAERLDDEVG